MMIATSNCIALGLVIVFLGALDSIMFIQSEAFSRNNEVNDIHHFTNRFRTRNLQSLVDSNTTTYSDSMILQNFKTTLDNTSILCWGDDYTGSRDDFIQDRHKELLGNNLSVLVFPMCIRLFQLGNTFGYYINDVACAVASGAHFLGVRETFR